jgi:single-strand DNA-binding protein
VAQTNILRAVVTGNLTADPDLRSHESAGNVCILRVAATTHRKERDSGEWKPKSNYLTVKVFGAQGENAARFLAKGRPVAVDGRLDWREWESPEGTRQSLEIIADTVQFLGSPEHAANGDRGEAPGGKVEEDEEIPL